MMRRVTLCLALALMGCSTVTDADRGVSLETEVSPTVLLIGDTVEVAVTVTNHRAEPLSLEGNHCNMHFDVRDARGMRFPASEAIVCLGIHIPLVLEPGKSHTLRGFWSGRLPNSSGAPVYAPPGTYRVRGRVFLLSESRTVAGGEAAIGVGVAAPD
jgi:hypothetical protein